MKNYTTQKIRNVVLLGGTRSGKTTLAEAMLYEGKVIDRRGTVEGIYSTPLYAEYNDHKINVIDAPGADDFVEGAILGLNVCESAVMLVNAG